MFFRVGIENNYEGIRTIAWALEHPGCFAYGLNTDTALVALPDAIRAYAAWIEQYEPAWLDASQIEVNIEDIFSNYDIDEAFDRVDQGSYTVDSWFQHDWKPLTTLDVERGLKLLTWSRADLISVLEGLSSEQWKFRLKGERWDIAGIVRHIGGAEWWYMERLGLAFPRSEIPTDPIERLEKVRRHLMDLLPSLENVKQVVGVDGEFWSPRKMLRRALWHERDHTEHIQKIKNLE